MKKALMMASVASMISSFNRENMRILQDLGYRVDIACNFEYGNESTRQRATEFLKEMEDAGVITFQIPVPRSTREVKNIITAYNMMKKICAENEYEIVHCHSPIGGVIARMACRNIRNKGTKVVYTAHGFHFYKGAPIKNWIFYYTIEKYISRYTDLLITINKEDFEIAKKFHAKRIAYIPGIGVNIKKFSHVDIEPKEKRKNLGISEDTIVILSIGELIERKNHETALKTVAKLGSQDFIYLICGEGKLDIFLKELAAKLDIESKVQFLGYRKDIPEICLISDIFVFPSYQEGLPVAVMEAMAAGLPIVCSAIRGNIDLIQNDNGGFLHQPEDIAGFMSSLELLMNNDELRKSMGIRNLNEAQNYDKEIINQKMMELYISLE